MDTEKAASNRSRTPEDKTIPNEGKISRKKQVLSRSSPVDHIQEEKLLSRGSREVTNTPKSTFGSGRDRPPRASIEDGGDRVRVLSLKKRPPMPADTAAYLTAKHGSGTFLRFDGAGVSTNDIVRVGGKRHLRGRPESYAVLPVG